MRQDPVLVVDDDDTLRETLVEALSSLPIEIETAASGSEALDILGSRNFAVVVTDLKMKDVDGLAVLREARERHPVGRVLILTGHGSREVAVQAMEAGASYYIEKPIDLAELRTKVSKCLEEHRRELEIEDLRGQMGRQYGIEGIIGQDPKMVRVLDVVQQIAPTNASVLVLGESGTGKELVARAIHALSPRAKRPFVALNCGGLSEGTIESELFGHERGAFTGAQSDREGKFEFADGGTLLLDEVGEMPQATQIKFLRVLEDRAVTRLGSNVPRKVDVRVVAATNADLEQRVQDGEFREDLLYRLKVVTVVLPPLRERSGDIKLLVEHFVRVFSDSHGKHVESVDRDALLALLHHDWPGNVRELRNAVESMVVRARGNILTVNELPPEIAAPSGAAGPVSGRDFWQFLAGKTVSEVEREHIRVTLELSGGNRVRAAQSLGISERTLYRKIKEYGL